MSPAKNVAGRRMIACRQSQILIITVLNIFWLEPTGDSCEGYNSRRNVMPVSKLRLFLYVYVNVVCLSEVEQS